VLVGVAGRDLVFAVASLPTRTAGMLGRGEQILIDYSGAVALQRVRESFLGRPLASEMDG
jgi:hypothetical protein